MRTLPRELSQMKALFGEIEREGLATPPKFLEVIAAAEAVPYADKARTDAEALLSLAIASGDARKALAAAERLAVARSGGMNDVRTNAETMAVKACAEGYPFDQAFAHIAETFNQAALRMHDAVAIVAPDEDPDELAPVELTAWQSIPPVAARLEALSGLLSVLYELATGVQVRGIDHAMAALCVGEPGDDHAATPHAVEIWRNPSVRRGDRWAQLAAAGYRIGAPTSPAEYHRWTVAEAAAPGSTVGMHE